MEEGRGRRMGLLRRGFELGLGVKRWIERIGGWRRLVGV